MISQEIVEQLRKEYPVGAKVVLVKMDDFQAPPVGTIGTVKYVDDAATIHIAWSTGSSLGVAYGEDECRIIE